MAVPAEPPRAAEALTQAPGTPAQKTISPRIPEPAGSNYQPRPVRPPRFTEEDLEPSRQIPWFWVLFLCLAAVTVAAAFYRLKSNQEPGLASGQIGAKQSVADRPENAPPLPPVPAPPQAAQKPAETPASEQPHPQRVEGANAAPWVAPVVVHQVQPGIPPGIRARIRDRVIVPVVVHVSASGKVASAFAQGNGDSLYRYLAEQAVVAAKLWRFRPARSKAGIPMEASKTVYFVFTP
jgi:hypothetical protein